MLAIESKKIIALKSRFFFTRTLIYFSFFLIPIYVQKSLVLPPSLKALLMMLYCSFMLGQWFLLGKEIDHRLKIYFEVNSSVDRIVYRLLLGMTFVILVYNILDIFTYKWSINFFWFFWILCGLYYSWPTRGKIIEESVISHFVDIKYLDSFEKTLLFLIVLFFIFSLPLYPDVKNMEALITYVKEVQPLSNFIWTFLKINFLPFYKYFSLFKIGFFTFFYFVFVGLFLFIFYSLLRHFFARRLALLGVFAVLSSWSFSKILSSDLILSHFSVFSVIWVWAGLWIIKSSTYKSGLFLGTIGFLASLLDPRYSLLIIFHFSICHLLFLNKKTKWFRKQFYKYFSFGFFSSLLTLLFYNFLLDGGGKSTEKMSISKLWKNILFEINEKAVFSLSLIGIVILIVNYIFPKMEKLGISFFIDIKKMTVVLVSLGVLFCYGLFVSPELIKGLGIIWPVVLFCLIPIEFIFQLSSRFRSNRNIIYLMYILICLLDSHFEGRIKIFLNFLKM